MVRSCAKNDNSQMYMELGLKYWMVLTMHCLFYCFRLLVCVWTCVTVVMSVHMHMYACLHVHVEVRGQTEVPSSGDFHPFKR